MQDQKILDKKYRTTVIVLALLTLPGCGAGSMKLPSIRLSVLSINSSSGVRRVCCWVL